MTTLIYDWGKTSKNIASRTKMAEAAEFYYQAVSQQNAYDISSNLVELEKTSPFMSLAKVMSSACGNW